MRRLNGILPLHETAHKIRPAVFPWQALLSFICTIPLFYFTTLTRNTPPMDWSFSMISFEAGCSISSMV